MAYENIIYEKANGIARVTLNRPEKLNALSGELQNELMDALADADDDDDAHVVVLKGNGRAFSAGYDYAPSGPRNRPGQERRLRQVIKGMYRTVEKWNTVWNLSKPIIAQVHGYCMAGGMELATHCDFIIAAEDAVFAYPPVRMAGSSPTHMWTYMVGAQWAKYIMMTGNSVDGKTAERIGLAWKSVPGAELSATVDELASTFAKIHVDLLAANKGICNRAIDLMGRVHLTTLAAEFDAVSHQQPSDAEFRRIMREQGLKAALEARDGPFRKTAK